MAGPRVYQERLTPPPMQAWQTTHLLVDPPDCDPHHRVRVCVVGRAVVIDRNVKIAGLVLSRDVHDRLDIDRAIVVLNQGRKIDRVRGLRSGPDGAVGSQDGEL